MGVFHQVSQDSEGTKTVKPAVCRSGGGGSSELRQAGSGRSTETGVAPGLRGLTASTGLVGETLLKFSFREIAVGNYQA